MKTTHTERGWKTLTPLKVNDEDDDENGDAVDVE